MRPKLWNKAENHAGTKAGSSPRRLRSHASTDQRRPESVRHRYSSVIRNTASPPEPTKGLATYSDIHSHRVTIAATRVVNPAARQSANKIVSRYARSN